LSTCLREIEHGFWYLHFYLFYFREAASIEHGLGYNFAVLTIYLGLIITNIVYSFYYSWRLTLVVGSILPIYLFFQTIISLVSMWLM